MLFSFFPSLRGGQTTQPIAAMAWAMTQVRNLFMTQTDKISLWYQIWPCLSREYMLTVTVMVTAVTLTFEEMRTPYASRRESCIQKFGNAYQWKEIDKRMPHFKSTFTTKFIKWLSEIKCYSQTMCTFLSHTRMFRDHFRHVLFETRWDWLRTLHVSPPWFCVQLDFYVYHTQKFACLDN